MKTIGIGDQPKPMTIIDARAEAKRRWGIWSFATVSRLHISKNTGKGYRGVGVRVRVGNDEVKKFYGWADTWEEAFNQATRAGY